MALSWYFPFNSINHDRVYDAEDFASFFSALLTNGVTPNPGTSLQVTAATGWNVSVNAGICVINGYIGRQLRSASLAITAASGANPRIDTVVARLSMSRRNIELAILQGEPASQPMPASLTRNSVVWELALARILVNSTDIQVHAANITDTRQNSALCGIVNSLITVDADGLFTQYIAAWENFLSSTSGSMSTWISEQQDAFVTWYGNLQTMLDGDVAAQLTAAVSTLQNKTNALLVYEIGRQTGVSIPANAWAASGDLFRAQISVPNLSMTGMDVDVILPPANAYEVFGSAVEMSAGIPVVAVYSAEQPAEAIADITVIVRGVR